MHSYTASAGQTILGGQDETKIQALNIDMIIVIMNITIKSTYSITMHPKVVEYQIIIHITLKNWSDIP
jgi:hypothetical protein